MQRWRRLCKFSMKKRPDELVIMRVGLEREVLHMIAPSCDVLNFLMLGFDICLPGGCVAVRLVYNVHYPLFNAYMRLCFGFTAAKAAAAEAAKIAALSCLQCIYATLLRFHSRQGCCSRGRKDSCIILSSMHICDFASVSQPPRLLQPRPQR